MTKSLPELLRETFPNAEFDATNAQLGIESFPEWDSLGHFNFMLQIEAHFGVQFTVEEMSELKALPQIKAALTSRGIVA
jgi:acyl carrier protein